MISPTRSQPVYRFGMFEAAPAAGELLKKGVRVKLQEQPFRLLCLLIESPGQVVTREAVRQHLWPGNTFVDFDASLSVAVGKLREALGDSSENPRFIETIPKRGYRFLAPVETVAPPGASGASAAAPSQQEPLATPVALPSRQFRASNIVPILLVALALVAVFVYRSRSKHPGAPAEAITPASRPEIRRSVAVLGFRNLPGRHEEDWLAQAFTEMIGTELAAGGNVRIVSDEDIARAKRELALGGQDSLAKATLQRLAKNPGADVVVLGSYTPMSGKDGGHVRLDIRMQDTQTGETIAESAVTGKEEDLFDLASRAGGDLRKSLGMNSISPQDAIAARASLPANQAAVRFYSEGLSKLRSYDSLGARDLLQRAVQADPNFPLAHSALGDAWSNLGFKKKSIAEAKRAVVLSASLPDEERLLIEGSYRINLSDWSGAIQTYGALFRLRPDNLEYGLDLASALYRVKREDALQTLQTLRKLPPPASDDLRIDLVEASAEIDHDLAASQAAAKRAIAKAEAQHSPMRVAEGYGILCQAGSGSGVSAEESIKDCEKAGDAYVLAGQPDNAARAMNDLAGNYFFRGDTQKAQALWTESAKEFRTLGDTLGLAATSNNLGDIYFTQGKLSEAKTMLQQSLPEYKAIDDKVGVAGALNDLGDLSREQGNLTAAEALYHQAKTALEQTSDKNIVATISIGLGNLSLDRGDLAGARKLYQQSLDIRTQAAETQAAAQSQVALAQLSIEEGHPTEAEAILRKALEQFQKEKQTDDELNSETALIRALVVQGKDAEAVAEVERAKPFAAKSDNQIAKLEFAVASAQVMASSNDPEAARVVLGQSLRTAHELGLLRVEFDIRLAQAELESESGKMAPTQSELSSLEKSARAKGFTLIADEAARPRH